MVLWWYLKLSLGHEYFTVHGWSIHRYFKRKDYRYLLDNLWNELLIFSRKCSLFDKSIQEFKFLGYPNDKSRWRSCLVLVTLCILCVHIRNLLYDCWSWCDFIWKASNTGRINSINIKKFIWWFFDSWPILRIWYSQRRSNYWRNNLFSLIRNSDLHIHCFYIPIICIIHGVHEFHYCRYWGLICHSYWI